MRTFVFLVPFAGSILFVHYASALVSVPTTSFWLFVAWWVGMSGSATVVLFAIDRAARRLLPLVALCKLSLVFPDAAPSRFRTAMRSNTVETLEHRIAHAKALNDRSTPVEAAERLLALVAELDSHDRLTRGHSERVRAYSRLIAGEMHLSSHELDLLNWAALLHDVGKLDVPAEILTKAGRPTDAEWSVLRRHPEFGAQLVEPMRGWLGAWSQAVAQHHERWDGKGYPQGIAGEEIGLAGRIVAVADAFDVITSVRSYKSAFASTTARDEIARCAGTQFDPRVVRAFLNISLGRLRFVMGPLSWLAHVPMLGRLPLTPAIGTVTASLGAVAATLAGGFVATPPAAAEAATVTTPVHLQATAPTLRRATDEDQSITVGVEQAAGGARIVSLRVSKQPSVGRARVSSGQQLVYSPPPNFSGKVSVGYEACWPGRGCRHGVVLISVVPVNDPPIARDDAARTRRATPVVIDVRRNDTDPDGDLLSISSISQLGAARARIVDGDIRWTPPPELLGKVTFRYRASDGHGGSAGALVTVAVTPTSPPNLPPPSAVPPDSDPPHPGAPPAAPNARPPPDNRPPQAVADQFSLPEGGSVIVDVLANDRDPDGDPIALVSVGGTTRGDARRVGDRVQFSAPSDYVGPIRFPYTVADSRGARDSARVTVSVLLVNKRPTFSVGQNHSVLEDAGPQAVPGSAGTIGSGGKGEAGQSVSFLVGNDNSALFSAQPSLASNGTLSYTPASNATGVATVTVSAKDDGGTANGGNDTSAAQTFTITVQPVNDLPSFTAGADQTVSEDAGPQTVSAWATNASPGPADESDQSLSFLVSNNSNSLFSAQPSIGANGTLSYTPASNASGVATVTVSAKDDGGTANGGNDTGPADTFTITVTPVNDPPVANPESATVAEDDPTGVTFNVLANDTDIDSGDTLSVLSYDASTIVNGTLTDNSNGSFTYTPDPGFDGTESFTYVAADGNGGTASATVTITITPVQHVPAAGNDAYSAAQDTPFTVAAPGILSNDGDQDGDPITVQTTPVTTPSNGSVTLAADGSLTYTPTSGFSGTDSFTYRIDDGTGLSADGTVTITVASSPPATSTLYFQPNGSSGSVRDMGLGLAPAAPQFADLGGDGNPGLTITESNGSETNTVPGTFLIWTYTAPSPLVLDGPVTLDLWSAAGALGAVTPGTLYAYLYDCTAGGGSCTNIASNAVSESPWNTSLVDWGLRTITIGSVTRTVPAGNELRVRLSFQSSDLWLTMTAAYPTALVVTLG
jgi:Bacterial Ig domain/HD domain